jgi:hypothetical protein
MTSKVIAPFEIYPDIDGEPLEAGYIYIGTAGLDPETSPINIYYDINLQVSATQPLRTIGGIISQNGNPANIFISGDAYSITVRNKNGSLVYTNLNVQLQLDKLYVLTYTELKATSVALLSDGFPIDVTTTGRAGQFIWRIGDYTSEVSDDTEEGLYVTADSDPTGSNGCWVRQFSRELNVQWFGAIGDGTTDDTVAFQGAIDTAALNNNRDLFRYHSVFVPSVDPGYRITGLDNDSRVTIRGESKWNTRIILSAVGDYFVEKPKEVENFWLDGVAIQNGATRIDEPSWTRADRGNTGVIIGNADGLGQMAGTKVRSCRFTNLANAVHRDSSFNTGVQDCYITSCWHGIFMRADLVGSNQEINMSYDIDNYIAQNSGIGIGWSSQGLLGAKQYDWSGCTVETCCRDAAHDGINGYWDSGGANVKTPHANTVYLEGDTGSYPNAIGIRATVMQLNGFYFQSLGTPITSPTTGSFWYFIAGEFVSTGNAYDIDMAGHTSGRNHFQQIAFAKGLNPADIEYTTVTDCSASGVLPDGNSNELRTNSTLKIAKASGNPFTLNRRSTVGETTQYRMQDVLAQSVELAMNSISARDSGTTDGTSANKLIDSSQNFISTASIGNIVKNTTDDTFAVITAIDSNTQLSLDADIMVSGEDYEIYFHPTLKFTKPVGIPSATVAQLSKYPVSTWTGHLLYCPDETGGATMVFSNGSNWVRVQDLATAS